MDIKEFENKLKESAENYKVSAMSSGGEQITYEAWSNTLLSFFEEVYKGGSLPSFVEILESLELATNSVDLIDAIRNYMAIISGLSSGGEPIKFSEAYTWKDDEVITKELLQKIEDKLRVSLTKSEVLLYAFMIAFNSYYRIIQESITQPKTTDSIPFHIDNPTGTSGAVFHDLGQLKTYYSSDFGHCPNNEPYVSITNESVSIVEPRGLFSIYTLPDSSGTAEDMSFSPKYYRSGVAYDLDSHYFDFNGLELSLEVLLRRVEESSTNFLKFDCDLTYSYETGIYSGSGEVLSTCNYTCSFDPKTFTVKLSLSSWEYFRSFYEVFGVDIMPKNKSYIPATFYGFIPLGSNKKYFISSGSPCSSELISENTYRIIE